MNTKRLGWATERIGRGHLSGTEKMLKMRYLEFLIVLMVFVLCFAVGVFGLSVLNRIRFCNRNVLGAFLVAIQISKQAVMTTQNIRETIQIIALSIPSFRLAHMGHDADL